MLIIDEDGKKPDVDPFQKEAGLYHPNCHCMERNIKSPKVKDIKLIIPKGKIDWLIKDKMHLINVMGYTMNDFQEFYSTLNSHIINSYTQGDYSIRQIDRYGVKITINIKIQGKVNKSDRYYNLESSWMIFPNGKLKCNTLIGGMI